MFVARVSKAYLFIYSILDLVCVCMFIVLWEIGKKLVFVSPETSGTNLLAEKKCIAFFIIERERKREAFKKGTAGSI